MDYRAVTKEDPKNDLTHWKYIKREKVNGKYRYTYNKDKAQRDVDYAKQEIARKKQNVEYDAVNEKLKYKQYTTDDTKEYLTSAAQRGYVTTLKILNNVGRGNLDDMVERFRKAATAKLSDLFKKLKDELGVH